MPFGGSEHDWAAVEVGASIAQARRGKLRLLGLASDEQGRDAGHLLAAAALAVQRLSGVVAEPVLVQPGRTGFLTAATDAGLLVVGLSPRWREEGLGDFRRAIAQDSPAPVLFIRRGTRGGDLASGESLTMLRWSSAGMTAVAPQGTAMPPAGASPDSPPLSGGGPPPG